jgi:hypothetical protein
MADNGGVPIMYETQSFPTRVQSSVKCHPEYIRTLPGILKIVEIVSFFSLIFGAMFFDPVPTL